MQSNVEAGSRFFVQGGKTVKDGIREANKRAKSKRSSSFYPDYAVSRRTGP
jgi:hypothetical protein